MSDKMEVTVEGSCVGEALSLDPEPVEALVGEWFWHTDALYVMDQKGKKWEITFWKRCKEPAERAYLGNGGGEGRRNVTLKRLRETASWPGLDGFWRCSVSSFSDSCAFGPWARTNYAFLKTWEGRSESLQWIPALVMNMPPTNALDDLRLVIRL